MRQKIADADCLLIVEDDAMVASCRTEYLTEAGVNVVGTAASAAAALSLAAELHPKLALVDIGLTGEMNGVELRLSAAAQTLGAFDFPLGLNGDPKAGQHGAPARLYSKAVQAQPDLQCA